MKKGLWIIVGCLLLSGCVPDTKYVERQSEAASMGVYGTVDAINKGRIDVADHMSSDLKRLYTPPNKPAAIKEIHDKDGNPIVILPERLKGKVVVVNSKDYNALVKAKSGLEVSLDLSKAYSDMVDKQLKVNNEVHDQLIKDYDSVQKELAKSQKSLVEKDLAILRLSIALAGVIALIVGFIVIKFFIL